MNLFAAWPLCRLRHRIATGISFGIVFVALGLFASAAQAAPDPPTLTGTNPPSPSTALQPWVQGNVEGVVVSGLGHSMAGLGPVAMGVESSELVTIYADDQTCKDEGAIVAEGSATELKGAGIRLEDPVGEDSSTILYATLTEFTPSTATSECSDGIVYRQVSSPPAAPEFTGSNPSPPQNDNFPRLIGVADPQATVSIYPSVGCPSGGSPAGSPLATGSGTQFGAEGIQVSVPDNSTTSFSAVASLAGFTSSCSSSTIVYTEETPKGTGGEEGGESGGGGGGSEGPVQTEPPAPNPPGKPPAPKLRTTPEGIANDNTPSITGKAPGAARIEVFGSASCGGPVLVEGSPAQLASGLPVEVADNTTHAFFGISIDGGGDRSPCSDEPVVYVEDSTPPRTRITSGPGVKTRRRTVLFRFADVDEDLSAHFLCKLDRRHWGDCNSPLRLKRLGHRRHLLRVKAVDAAGNRERVGTKRRFRVSR